MSPPRLLTAAATVVALTACTVPPQNATITIDAPSESASQWHPVADYLDHRCGTLDCHGDLQRNLIVWGCDGLRYGDAAVPGCAMTPTTDGEYNATFRSVVGLEPAVMTDVVQTHGADSDNLTLLRKARGEEAHKGGALIVPGDDQDQCITSWLSGSTNTDACQQAIKTTQ
jgi:hypothetical protein